MSKHWTPEVGDEVLIETQKRSGLANIVSIDLEPLVSDSPDYFVHMRDGSDDLWVFREEMEFMHRNEDPTPPPAPVTDIDERRIAARDQEIRYLQWQIAALKDYVERLRAALEPFAQFYDVIKENDQLALKADVFYTYNDVPLRLSMLKAAAQALGKE